MRKGKDKRKVGVKIVDTLDSYKVIDEFYQRAEDSKSGYKFVFGSFSAIFFILSITGLSILYFFASTTLIDCQQTRRANPDAHTNAIISCEATRRYLLKADKKILALTPVKGVSLNKSDDTCRVEFVSLSGNHIPLTSHYSSTQCGTNDKVKALDRFIKSDLPKQDYSNTEVIKSFSFGSYFLAIVSCLVCFLLCLRCLFIIFKSGVMTRIEFDKRLNIISFHYITLLKSYKKSYRFNEVMDISIKTNVDSDTHHESIVKHRILTADNKWHKISMGMSADEARAVNSKMRQILTLPANG